MLFTSTELNIVLSCDAPLVSVDILREILKGKTKQFDIVITKYQNQHHPLIGLYSKAVEFYNGKEDDKKYMYYQEKIQNLIQRPKVMEMLSAKEEDKPVKLEEEKEASEKTGELKAKVE